MLRNPEIASASSDSVKRARASERESQRQSLFSNSARLPATSADHVPHLLTVAEVLNALNADLIRFWLTVCLGNKIPYLKIDYVIRFPSWVQFKERDFLKAQVKKRQLRSVQLTVRARRGCLQSPAVECKDTHWNFGAPRFPELHPIIIIPLPTVRGGLTMHSYHVAYSSQPQHELKATLWWWDSQWRSDLTVCNLLDIWRKKRI